LGGWGEKRTQIKKFKTVAGAPIKKKLRRVKLCNKGTAMKERRRTQVFLGVV